MSLNHILQSTVPDDETLDVKFNDLQLTGKIVGPGVATTTYSSVDGTRNRGDIAGFHSFFNDESAYGDRRIIDPSFSIISSEIRGEAIHETGATTQLNIRFNLGNHVLLLLPNIDWTPSALAKQFICTAKIHNRGPLLWTVYLDWNVPDNPMVSVGSATLNISPAPTYSPDDKLDVEVEYINGSIDDYLTSSYGTISTVTHGYANR
jgi:hypothetical protein